MDWVDENIALLRTAYPDLEVRVEGEIRWVRIPAYPVALVIWTLEAVEVAFRIPGHAGEAPYGFWVCPGLLLPDGRRPNNYAYPAATPWGADWGQFSFSPAAGWLPRADVRAGDNMLHFARAIAGRLNEGA
jgi:hypothetical protein